MSFSHFLFFPLSHVSKINRLFHEPNSSHLSLKARCQWFRITSAPTPIKNKCKCSLKEDSIGSGLNCFYICSEQCPTLSQKTLRDIRRPDKIFKKTRMVVKRYTGAIWYGLSGKDCSYDSMFQESLKISAENWGL